MEIEARSICVKFHSSKFVRSKSIIIYINMFEYVFDGKLRMRVISRCAHVLISGNISTMHLNQTDISYATRV